MRNNIIHMKPLFIFIFLVGSLTCIGQARFDTVYTNLPNQTPTILFCESTLCSWNYLKRFGVDDFCYYSPIKNEIQTLFSVSRPSELITGFSRLYSVNDSNFILIEYEVVEWPRFSSLIKLALLDSNFKVLRSKKHIADYERAPFFVDFSYPRTIKIITEKFNEDLSISQIEFFEFDSNFELVQSNVIDLNLRLSDNAITKDSDGNYIIAADSFYSVGVNSGIYSINNNFNKINRRIELDKSLIPKGAKYYGNRVISSADSSVFYAIGNVAYGLYEAHFMSYLIKFNAKGEVLWTKFYKPKDFANKIIHSQSFTDVCFVKENRIMIIGSVKDKETNIEYSWVLQLDKNGCVNDDQIHLVGRLKY